MGDRTGIEWADATWNPMTGCTKISLGCDHCYAERLAERFRGVEGHAFARGFDLTYRPERLDAPMRWRRPREIFVNSMSDLFHELAAPAFVASIFDVMERARRHRFMILTKRAGSMRRFVMRRYGGGAPPPHIALGVSGEDRRHARARLRILRRTPAAVRFLSAEPLLGPLDLGDAEYDGVGWIVAGGESGPMARPPDASWFRALRDQASALEIPFHFKQWGRRAMGRELDGRLHDARPAWPEAAA